MMPLIHRFGLGRLSIRTQLVLLALALLLPLAGGFAWIIVHQREQARAAGYAQVSTVANHIAAQIRTVMRSSETTLSQLAQRASVRALDPLRCDPIFQDHLLLSRESTALVLRDVQGRLICTSASNVTPLQASQAAGSPWFREALGANKFRIGDAQKGFSSGRWVVNLSYPVHDDAGQVSAVLVLGMDLLKLQERLAQDGSPGMHLAVFDREFKFVLRSIEPEQWIGRPLPAAQRAYLENRDTANFPARNILGVSQLWSYITLPDIGWRVTIGLPEDELLAPSQAVLWRTVAIGMGALLLAVVSGWLISRPIRRLAHTSAQITAGGGTARVRIEGPAEIEALAGHFNRLLDERDRTLETLRQSEQRFVLATQGSSDGFWDWNVVSGEDFFSERFCELLGYASDELRPHVDTWRELLHPDDAAPALHAVQEHFERRVPYDVEMRLRAKAGEYRWFRSRGQAVWDGAGRPLRMAGSIVDITLRRQQEQTLRDNEARLFSLFEYSPLSVWEEDFSELKTHLNSLRAAGVNDVRAYCDAHPEEVARCAGLVKIIDVNLTSVEFFGAASKEELARNLLHYFSAESLDVFKEEIIALAEGRMRFESEISIRTPQGEAKLLFLSLVVVPGHEQTLARVLVSFLDISERKSVEERLRESERGMRAAQQLAKVGSWELDLTSGELHWSPEIYRIFEIDPNKFGASYDAFLDAIHPEDREAVNAAYTASLVDREPYEITHRLKMADGRIKHVQERCESEFDAAGKPLCSLGTVQDVTAQQLAELRLRAALREKEVLLKEVYHRVKNNLQVVASLLNLQGRGVVDTGTKDLLAESANRVKSMALVHEQLYRSQDLSNIALGEYLEQLAGHLRSVHWPLSGRVRLQLEVADMELGLETAVPLGLVVNELVSNAYKHGYAADAPGGEIVLSVQVLDGGAVQLQVSDDGRGLPEGFDLARMTTLGMQLVVTLAEQLGGELSQRTTSGGASFQLVFRPEAREALRLVV